MTTTSTDRAVHSSLVAHARRIRKHAYAPYSGFRAAAVVEDDAGDLHDGVIVENVSLGLAMCAERVALFATVAAGGRPRRLVLVAPSTGSSVTWPCGACLQIALELGGPDLEVVVAAAGRDRDDVSGTGNLAGGAAPDVQVSTVGSLLPSGPFLSSVAMGG